MRHLQELVTAGSVLKPSLSQNCAQKCFESHLLLHTSEKPGKTQNPLGQPGRLHRFVSSWWILQLQTRLQNKTKKKLTSNTSSLLLNMWDDSLDACLFPAVKLTHTSSLLPWSVWKLFFPSPSFSFPSFLVLICGTRMTLISASLLFIHVTSLTALHQIRLLGFRRALRRHWELL